MVSMRTGLDAHARSHRPASEVSFAVGDLEGREIAVRDIVAAGGQSLRQLVLHGLSHVPQSVRAVEYQRFHVAPPFDSLEKHTKEIHFAGEPFVPGRPCLAV
jgi:hypothetical protein